MGNSYCPICGADSDGDLCEPCANEIDAPGEEDKAGCDWRIWAWLALCVGLLFAALSNDLPNILP